MDRSLYRSGKWLMSSYEGLDEAVIIPSIQCALKLADVYERVSFVHEEPAPEEKSGQTS